jgi:hypothetical protein
MLKINKKTNGCATEQKHFTRGGFMMVSRFGDKM